VERKDHQEEEPLSEERRNSTARSPAFFLREEHLSKRGEESSAPESTKSVRGSLPEND